MKKRKLNFQKKCFAFDKICAVNALWFLDWFDRYRGSLCSMCNTEK